MAVRDQHRVRANNKFTQQHPELPVNSNNKTASRKEWSKVKKARRAAKAVK